jgi:hypothetical protein
MQAGQHLTGSAQTTRIPARRSSSRHPGQKLRPPPASIRAEGHRHHTGTAHQNHLIRKATATGGFWLFAMQIGRYRS